MSRPRGVIPSFSNDTQLALCKGGPRVRNTYEVRLCLYFAVKNGKEFLLVVNPSARIDADLEAHLDAHGGRVVRADGANHSVYFGAEDSSGGEIDGWVASAADQWSKVLGRSTSHWLKENLVVGREFHGDDLAGLRTECRKVPLEGMNIDDEPLSEAILKLVRAAEAMAGRVFIQ